MKNLYKKNSNLVKSERKRFLFSKNEICLSSFNLLLDCDFSKVRLKRVLFSMYRQFLNHSLVSVNNNCIMTGNNKSIYKEFRFSRIALRKSLNFGLISGIKHL